MGERKGNALIFGAGNVGRGFLGHLLYLSGYRLTFADIDQSLLQAIRERQGYTLRLADQDRVEDVWIAPVHAIHVEDATAMAQAITAADIAVTAVGARALPALAQSLATGLVQRARARPEVPLNIILCENLRDAHRIFRELIRQNLPSDLHGYLDQRVGLVMSVIARMVTTPTAEMRAADPTLIIAEPYQHLPVDRHGFVGPIPAIIGMEPRDRFDAWVDWKLYIHNAGHAVLAYLGYRRGHHYGYQALEDPQVGPWSAQAMRESAQALVAEHGFDRAQLEADVRDLLRRFANRALADPISRLARDPLRKLAPADRLVGAATLCLRHGIVPDALSWGIAAGLTFDDPADAGAVELQRRLKTEGLDRVLAEVCGLDPTSELARWVRVRYQRLRAGEMPLPQREGTVEFL
jgi:mannitol-1-phosphate 5-dehydrogenase